MTGRHVINVLIGFDQLANTFWGGLPDETISSRVGKAAFKGIRRAIVIEAAIDLIFAVIRGERHHCQQSIEWDEA